MASASCRSSILAAFCFILCFSRVLADSEPEFDVLNIVKTWHDNRNTKIEFEVGGKNIAAGLQVRTSTSFGGKNAVCDEDVQYEINEVSVNNSVSGRYVISVPENVTGVFFLCLPRNGTEDGGSNWYHQGPNISVRAPFGDNYRKRQTNAAKLMVMGIRLQSSSKDPDFDENGVPDLLADAEHTIRLFGVGFVENMAVTFTAQEGRYGDKCEFPVAKDFAIHKESFTPRTVTATIKLPALKGDAETFYICVKATNGSTDSQFIHQGSLHWLQIKTFENLLPMWVSIVIMIICLTFSSLFSGLNLGLLSMDRTDLKILCNTGTPEEKEYARVITPVRDHGNYLLCSILLGNVFVNSIFTILLEGLTTGWISVVFSTIAIVLLGEITPQAVCSRHGLLVGAKTIYITKLLMVLTFPLAYPVSLFLDFILGEEIGNVYNRERLKELVQVTSGEHDLDKDEVNIISGALELRKKTVAEVMTKIEDVFMLDYEAVLNFETVSEIMQSGYSRVPVFEGNRQNIATMLYVKDLAFVDPDDNTPLKTLCQFYQNACNFVLEDVTLDVMFKIFKEGNKGHMAFVHRVNNQGSGDPFYETTGLITLEDVIEELIQAEIMDETDVFTDNKSKRRRPAEQRLDFSGFAERRHEDNRIRISPQLTLAAFQFLSTSVTQFIPSVISETVLKKLLKQDIVFHIKKNLNWQTDPANLIYQEGKTADYFVLILVGHVEVKVGLENLTFESGPFTYFGTQALVQTIGISESGSNPHVATGSLDSIILDTTMRHVFHPDYTVRACNEVIYLRISRSLYLAAKRATLMERSQNDNLPGSEHFDHEVDQLLNATAQRSPNETSNQPRKRSTKSLHLVQVLNPNDLETSHSSRSGESSPRNRRSAKRTNQSKNDDDISTVHEDESLLPKLT